jgi:hypothetical protein
MEPQLIDSMMLRTRNPCCTALEDLSHATSPTSPTSPTMLAGVVSTWTIDQLRTFFDTIGCPQTAAFSQSRCGDVHGEQ